MTSSSKLDGSKMIMQSAAAVQALTEENSAMTQLKAAYSKIVSDSVLEGEGAKAMREHMSMYCDLIDAAISTNELDIDDYKVVASNMPFEYLDGNVILTNKQKALNEKASDESERDRCYREWMDRSEIFSSSYYYYRYIHYCHEVDDDVAEYNKWLAKEQKYDNAESATAGLFASSGTLRSMIQSNLTTLSGGFAFGDYNDSGMSITWKEELVDIFEELYYTTDDKGNKVIDAEKIFETLDEGADMSEMERLALIEAMGGLNITIDPDTKAEDMKKAVFDGIENKMNDNLLDPATGQPKSSPFDELSFEERDLYVILYEDYNTDDAELMQGIDDYFTNDGYAGYETDLTNIKFLVYTAEEPFKSIYLQTADDLVINQMHYTGTSKFCNGVANADDYGIYIDVSDMDQDNKAAMAYTTFFHEWGHLIDYEMGQKAYDGTIGAYDSYVVMYNADSGYTFTDALQADVEQKIADAFEANWNPYLIVTPDEFKTYEGQKKLAEAKAQMMEDVRDAIMNEIDISAYGKPYIADPNTKIMYDAVVRQINTDLDKYANPVTGSNYATDIYGGFSGDTLMGQNHRFGHPPVENVFHNSSPTSCRIYWLQTGTGYSSVNSDGSGLTVVLDNGDTFTESNNYLTDYSLLDHSSTKTPGDPTDFADKIIASDGDMIYNSSTGKEFLAEYLSANMTRNVNELNCFGYYGTDAMDYADKMIDDMSAYVE